MRRIITRSILTLVLLTAPAIGRAQTVQGARNSVTSQGIFLVFPFENAGASSRFDWLSEGLEELTIQRLSAAGQQVYSHAGRTAELDRYGLPSSARLSHATMLRIGAELDADFVVFGKYLSDGNSLSLQARILRVNPAGLDPVVQGSGKLESLMDVHAKVAWKLLTGKNRTYPLSFADFSKLQRPLRLDAFEHYIRALLANEDDARIRELKEATRGVGRGGVCAWTGVLRAPRLRIGFTLACTRAEDQPAVCRGGFRDGRLPIVAGPTRQSGNGFCFPAGCVEG